MPKFAISILSLNRLELTKACIQSVIANSEAGTYHLILTDNGSTDGSREYLSKFAPEATVILNDANEGFIAPNNRAFSVAQKLGSIYAICLNNDVEVAPGWLEKLAAPLDADPLGALSGPDNTCRSLHDNMDGYPGDTLEYIEGSCLCAKISLVEKHGSLFSEYLDFIYGDDSDLSLRMREAGYNIYQAPFEIKHVRCATTHDPAVKARCEQARQHNHKVGMKRWGHYLRTRTFSYPLVVKRSYAIGDVILTTPVIAALKAAKPEREIWVETDFPEVFTNNPHVARAGKNLGIDDAFPVVDLNGAYEKAKEVHIQDAYAEEANSQFLKKQGMQLIPSVQRGLPQLYPSDLDRLWAKNLAIAERFSSKVCVMHADDSSWPGKAWPMERFAEIATWLVSLGFHVVAIGRQGLPHGFNAFNLVNRTSILQLAALMEQSTLFIGGDSAPMHVALAMNCPTVALFGVTSSKYIVHGSGSKACLDATTESAGARHRLQGVEHTDLGKDAIESHSVDDVKEAVRKLGVL